MGFTVPGGQRLQAELWEAPGKGLTVPAGLQNSTKHKPTHGVASWTRAAFGARRLPKEKEAAHLPAI